MKKQFAVLVALAASAGCATGFAGVRGIAIPGLEAATVIAANQALIGSIAGQGLYGQGYGAPYGTPVLPVCSAEELAGLPPISVAQPVVVRVRKDGGHKKADIIGGAALGAGLGGLLGGAKGVLYGAAGGAGAGLLVANHEEEYCWLLPAGPPPQ